jgi:pimeloyl-ACP methyl ester carboxylesterase
MMVMTQSRSRGAGVRKRLLADDGTMLAAEHIPASGAGDRRLGVVVAHGFMAHSRHPRTRRIAGWLRPHAGLVLLDLRGHGASGGVCTLGWQEVRDVEAAVGWARTLGYERVATLGFSLGATAVLRHAALYGGVDALAAVSGPGQWYYRGTARMRLLHRLVLRSSGRTLIRLARRTRVSREPWAPPLPIDPAAAAAEVEAPLLVVHGERDDLFPVHHAERICAAAGSRATLWVEPQLGHAEAAVDAILVDRIGEWLEQACQK